MWFLSAGITVIPRHWFHTHTVDNWPPVSILPWKGAEDSCRVPPSPNSIILLQWSSNGSESAPSKGTLVMSGDICGCHNWREGCSWYWEGRDQRCYLTGESPPQRISLPWMLWVPRQRNPIPERANPLSAASKLRFQCFQFWNKLRGKSFVFQTAGCDTFFFLMPETSPIWPPLQTGFQIAKTLIKKKKNPLSWQDTPHPPFCYS